MTHTVTIPVGEHVLRIEQHDDVIHSERTNTIFDLSVIAPDLTVAIKADGVQPCNVATAIELFFEMFRSESP